MITDKEFFYSNPFYNVSIPKYGHKVTYINPSGGKLKKYLDKLIPNIVTVTTFQKLKFKIKWKIKDLNIKYRIKSFYSRHIYIKSRLNTLRYRISKYTRRIKKRYLNYRKKKIIPRLIRI